MAKTILIAEDEASIREALRDKLVREGYEIVEAKDGADALGKIQNKRPALLLLDLMMPRIDGYGVLKALRADETAPQIPVIVLTNKDTSQDIFTTLEHQAQDYFIKAETSLETIAAAVDDRIGKP